MAITPSFIVYLNKTVKGIPAQLYDDKDEFPRAKKHPI